MSTITIKVQIEAPELAAAINNVAEAFKSRPVTVPVAPVVAPAAPAEQTPPPAEKPVEAPVATPTDALVTSAVNGVASVPTNAPAPAPVEAPAPMSTAISDPAPAAPAAPAMPAAPTAPAEKVYTFDDITNAGAQLLEAGKMEQLMGLLKINYNVQAVTQLRPDQYAAVAADLRKLGARI